MQEDAYWVKQTLEGDGQAFHRLIMKYYTAIYALIMSWVKNTEDAKDLAQETFLKAYQELGSLRHPEQFRVWLRQIARHQCQDWLRKSQQTFLQLDEDMICEAPSADELLVLRETLAKVMLAIDELPESESVLLRERYLDDAGYDELETRYGLSRSVLSMRLLRARQHLREKIRNIFLGLWTLSRLDVVKKIIAGGSLAMKVGTKVKIIIAVTTVAIISGTGIILWDHQRSYQGVRLTDEMAQKALYQTAQEEDSTPTTAVNSAKAAPDVERKDAEVPATKLDVPEKAETTALTEDANNKAQGTVEPKKEPIAGEFTLADAAARMPVLAEEIRTGMGHINTRGDEVIAIWQSGNVSSEKGDWINEQIREINKEWKDLYFNKIWPYYAYKLNLEGRQPYPLAEGGEFYELAQRLPHFVFPRDFDNANVIWLGDDK